MRPLLKWAGGKQWLSPTLVAALSPGERLIEPFAGGGSFFFRAEPKTAILGDTNALLMTTYRVVAAQPIAVAKALQKWQPDRETYNSVRAFQPDSEVGVAARFIYLNHTSYGGMWRVNRAGVFNVPFSGRTSAWLPGETELSEVATLLRRAALRPNDFRGTLNEAKPGDVVYCDPPYAGSGTEVVFNRYSELPFTDHDHHDLACALQALVKRGIRVMLSVDSRCPGLERYLDIGLVAYEHGYRQGLGYKDRARETRQEYLLFTEHAALAAHLQSRNWSRV